MKVVVGVDVGGTNTDAVLVTINATPPQVVSSSKCVTTSDVTSGIQRAIAMAIADSKPSKTHPLDIAQINIGTTHFVNAIIQRKHLTKVSVIRLCGSSSRYVPPFIEFDADLCKHIKGPVFMVDGGYEYDGRVIKDVSKSEIEECVKFSLQNGINNFAVSGIFSAVRNEQEEEAKNVILASSPSASITLSSEIGQLGLLERENAAILNECLKPLSRKTIESFAEAISSLGLNCPFYLTQNDGTIIDKNTALKKPIRTFASGTTNSMRGAAFLSGVKDAIVIDIGGTSTDVGELRNGFPREASSEVKIGGVRTNFHMPDVLSIGLGGGSYVTLEPELRVGPRSAGYNLKNEALVFESKEDKSNVTRRMTATDIAVAGKLCDIGYPDKVKEINPDLALCKIREMVEKVVDQIKTSNEDLPVILVGGGAILLDSSTQLRGASKLIKPIFSDVANAVGAALSQVSGNVDRIYSLMEFLDQDKLSNEIEKIKKKDTPDLKQEFIEKEEAKVRKLYFERARDTVLKKAEELAISEAVKYGADEKTVDVVEKSDTSLSYIPGNATRIQIKAVGNLALTKDVVNEVFEFSLPEKLIKDEEGTDNEENIAEKTGEEDHLTKQDNLADPLITGEGEWILSESDVECVGIGAGILGCGGGGNPHLGKLLGKMAIREGKIIRVVTPEVLKRISESKTKSSGINCGCIPIAMMGAPLIGKEKLLSRETVKAIRCLQNVYENGYCDGNMSSFEFSEHIESSNSGMKYIKHYNKIIGESSPRNSKSLANCEISAILCFEIGGGNSMEPLLASSELGIPAIDADMMGRAFPEFQMTTPFIYGRPPYPCAISDDKGRTDVVLEANDAKDVENQLRNSCIEMGCRAGLAASSLRIPQDLETLIPYSLSHAWRLGRAVLTSRQNKTSPIQAIIDVCNGFLSITGKITDVSRETTGGFNRGHVKIEGMENFSGKRAKIDFQNENLVARIGKLEEYTDENLSVTASVPDLISIVDNDTGEPIPTEDVCYGQRVAVLTLPSHPLLRTPQALKVVGPQAFGYDDIKFQPCGPFNHMPPVGPT